MFVALSHLNTQLIIMKYTHVVRGTEKDREKGNTFHPEKSDPNRRPKMDLVNKLILRNHDTRCQCISRRTSRP